MMLSPRQQEVAALIAQGMTNKQIGIRLGMQVGTVKTHASSIYARLGVQTRVQAALRLARA